MAYEQRDMSGTLFKNDDKKEGDKRPNAKGSCMIDGVEYWVDAWTKDGKKGKFQSLAFKRKEQQAAKPARSAPAAPADDDDDAPF
jgi:hypothetical protein